MTVLLFFITIFYSTIQIILIINLEESIFTFSTYIPDMEEIAKKDFGEYDDTFNMLLNIRNDTFDWFDNPYISPNVYQLDNTFQPKPSQVKVTKCQQEDKLRFMDQSLIFWYANAICFLDKTQIKMKSNWYDREFHSIFISLDYCNEKTYNGTCATKEEIDN